MENDRRITAEQLGHVPVEETEATYSTSPASSHFPALAVACPACGSTPGVLCTSHSGTRVRRSDVHQARTAAHRAQALPAA